MYDRRETAAANDRFWKLIRLQLASGPESLCRNRDPWEIWQSPDLFLAQTCSYPYRTCLQDKVTLVGTPDYGLNGCAPGYYYSVLVVRKQDGSLGLSDFADRVFAVNDGMSQSGWVAAQGHAADSGLSFSQPVLTGSHLKSAKAVAENRADIAAIDAISWDRMCLWDDFTDNLTVLEKTTPSPGLPLIAAKGANQDKLFTACASAIARLGQDDRDILHLKGMTYIPSETYIAQPTPAPLKTQSRI